MAAVLLLLHGTPFFTLWFFIFFYLIYSHLILRFKNNDNNISLKLHGIYFVIAYCSFYIYPCKYLCLFCKRVFYLYLLYLWLFSSWLIKTEENVTIITNSINSQSVIKTLFKNLGWKESRRRPPHYLSSIRMIGARHIARILVTRLRTYKCESSS